MCELNHFDKSTPHIPIDILCFKMEIFNLRIHQFSLRLHMLFIRRKCDVFSSSHFPFAPFRPCYLEGLSAHDFGCNPILMSRAQPTTSHRNSCWMARHCVGRPGRCPLCPWHNTSQYVTVSKVCPDCPSSTGHAFPSETSPVEVQMMATRCSYQARTCL